MSRALGLSFAAEAAAETILQESSVSKETTIDIDLLLRQRSYPTLKSPYSYTARTHCFRTPFSQMRGDKAIFHKKAGNTAITHQDVYPRDQRRILLISSPLILSDSKNS